MDRVVVVLVFFVFGEMTGCCRARLGRASGRGDAMGDAVSEVSRFAIVRYVGRSAGSLFDFDACTSVSEVAAR